jgi:hypothetical protein
MPWLILLFIVLWLLERLGMLPTRRRTTPAAPPRDADRAAASAWSTYVPAGDASEPDRSTGQFTESAGSPERAYDDVEAEGTPQPGGGAIVDPADAPQPDPVDLPEDHD